MSLFKFWYTGFYVDVDMILSVYQFNALYILGYYITVRLITQ